MKAVRAVAVWVMAVGVLVFGPETALACSCVTMSDTEALAQSDVVLAGYVVEGAYPGEVGNVNDTLGKVAWTFLPDTLVKGADAGKIEVLSQSQGTACGVNFLIGQRYLVFAHEDNGNLVTSSCDRTRAYSNEVMLVGAKKVPGVYGPKTQASAEESPWRSILPIGFALLAGGLALFALRRKRRRRVETMVE